MEQPPAVRLRKQGEPDCSGRSYKPCRNCIEDGDPKVAWPALRAGNRPAPFGTESFPKRHQRKNPKETTETKDSFVL